MADKAKSDKVKGPASYFPSIEKKYGKPITHWQDLVRARMPAKHMELVAFLKEEHGMGRGHANAVVAATLKGLSSMSESNTVDGRVAPVVRRLSATSAKDLAAVQEIYLAEFPASERKPDSYIAEVADRADSCVILAQMDGKIAGFALVRGLLQNNAHLLEYIAIAKPFQSLGLGRVLLDHIAASVPGPIFAEIERPVETESNSIEARRVNFYLRANYRTIAGFEYRMPQIGDDSPPPMWLMVKGWPGPKVTAGELGELTNAIYREIYGVQAYPASEGEEKTDYFLL